MNSASLVRKIGGYIFYYISAILFYYFSISMALHFYLNASSVVISEFFPLILRACTCLIIMLLSEFFLLHSKGPLELKWSSIFNMAYHGVYFLALVLIAVWGFSSISDGQLDFVPLLSILLPLFIFSLFQIFFGAKNFYLYKKIETEEKKIPEKESK